MYSNIKSISKMDIEASKYIEEPWTIIESYFKGQHLDQLVRHQLESYNNFISNSSSRCNVFEIFILI